MNKDQSQGYIDEAKGKAKEVVGKLFGNRELALKGKVQNVSGKAKMAYGEVKEDVKNATDNK